MADRDMSGSLSKNLRKEKPSHADYAGAIVIEGREVLAQRLGQGRREGQIPQLVGEAGGGRRLSPNRSW